MDFESLLKDVKGLPPLLTGRGKLAMRAELEKERKAPLVVFDVYAADGVLNLADFKVPKEGEEGRNVPVPAEFETLKAAVTLQAGAIGLTNLDMKNGDDTLTLKGGISPKGDIAIAGFHSTKEKVSDLVTSLAPQKEDAKPTAIESLKPDFTISGSLKSPVVTWSKSSNSN